MWTTATAGQRAVPCSDGDAHDIIQAATAQSLQKLGSLSLEELTKVEITSVSKRPEPLGQTPAAVYVITADEIRRSGVASLTEALRLAPNLEVARVDSQSYAISACGLQRVPAGTNDRVILVVEDDEEVRANTVVALRDLGHGVLEAADGPSALRVLESQPDVDLLLLTPDFREE